MNRKKPSRTQPRRPPPSGRRRWMFRLLGLALGCAVAFCLLEGFLRFSDPFSLRVKNGRLSLPVNQRYEIANDRIDRLPKKIVHTKNSLGLRGADPPDDFDDRLTIITVGGSTTECYYLSDGLSWPDHLKTNLDERFTDVWLNNAGLDGHSTYGHMVLLTSYLAPLRPKVLLYLVGLNDVGYDRGNLSDSRLTDTGQNQPSFVGRIYQSLVDTYAVFSAYDNYCRYRQAKQLGLVHGNLGHEQLALSQENSPQISSAEADQLLREHRDRYIPAYRAQVLALVQTTRQSQIVPVLITQPALYGLAGTIDDVTGVDLGIIGVGDLTGSLKWQVLELYNEVTRSVARELNVTLVDLAESMPKSSRYFYDHHHFTVEGAKVVGRIVSEELREPLAERFPQHAR